MTNDIERRNNAKRLAWAIYRSADDFTIKNLARLLNYYEEQLRQDINDLPAYISELEAKLSEYENE